MSETGLIYQKIPAIMRAVGAVGKNKKNTGQGYNFRGIDDMYNALHEHLCDAGVFATPRVLRREREERTTGKGGLLIYTILDVEHVFYAEDGSNVSVVTTGEAMDSGDKSSNKAMSAAFKYALMELFCIPTEEKLDTEYENPQPAPRQQRSTPPRSQPAAPQHRSTPAVQPPSDAMPPELWDTIQRTAKSLWSDNWDAELTRHKKAITSNKFRDMSRDEAQSLLDKLQEFVSAQAQATPAVTDDDDSDPFEDSAR